MNEEVILVNEKDEPIGSMDKMQAHQRGVLHRAFSIFIFNRNGEMLLQQRTLAKYHSGGKWSNACCSHPRPGEQLIDAANRRLNEELGFDTSLREIFAFVYKAQFDNDLVEYEFDHVFVGEYQQDIRANPHEVQDHRFISLKDLKNSLEVEPASYTQWFLIAFPQIEKWWKENYQLS